MNTQSTNTIDFEHIAKCHSQPNIPLTYEEAYLLGVYTIKAHKRSLQGEEEADTNIGLCIGLIGSLLSASTLPWNTNSKDARDHKLNHQHELPINANEQVMGFWQALVEELLQLKNKQ